MPITDRIDLVTSEEFRGGGKLLFNSPDFFSNHCKSSGNRVDSSSQLLLMKSGRQSKKYHNMIIIMPRMMKQLDGETRTTFAPFIV